MTPLELEAKYAPHVVRRGGVRLLPAELAVALLNDSRSAHTQLRGVEAFRLFDDGGIQPSLDFSNVSYGRITGTGESTNFEPDLQLRSGWREDPDAIASTQALILEGQKAGYAWFEVSLENLDDGQLLFFRGET